MSAREELQKKKAAPPTAVQQHNLSLDTHTRGDLFAGAAAMFADMNVMKDQMHDLQHMPPVHVMPPDVPSSLVLVSMDENEETDYLKIMQSQAPRVARTPAPLPRFAPVPIMPPANPVMRYQEDEPN